MNEESMRSSKHHSVANEMKRNRVRRTGSKECSIILNRYSPRRAYACMSVTQSDMRVGAWSLPERGEDMG